MLVRMENGLLIDMHDPVVRFCVSFITSTLDKTVLDQRLQQRIKTSKVMQIIL